MFHSSRQTLASSRNDRSAAPAPSARSSTLYGFTTQSLLTYRTGRFVTHRPQSEDDNTLMNVKNRTKFPVSGVRESAHRGVERKLRVGNPGAGWMSGIR